MRNRVIFTLLSFLLALPLGAQAADERGWREFRDSAARQSGVADRLFSADEQRLIRSYFRDHRYGEDADDRAQGRDKPKKKKKLPPGLQNHILVQAL